MRGLRRCPTGDESDVEEEEMDDVEEDARCHAGRWRASCGVGGCGGMLYAALCRRLSGGMKVALSFRVGVVDCARDAGDRRRSFLCVELGWARLLKVCSSLNGV